MQKEKLQVRTCTIADILDPYESSKEKFFEYLKSNYTEEALREIIWSLEKLRKEGSKRETKKVWDVRRFENDLIQALETGEIIIGDVDYTYDLPESEERFERLVKNNLVEELTVKQVHQLVKLLGLTEQFQTQGITYELCFESDQVNHIFEKL